MDDKVCQHFVKHVCSSSLKIVIMPLMDGVVQ